MKTIAALVIIFVACHATVAATLPTGFTETPVATGLSTPTAMAFAPDGRLFICQQGGQLRVIKNGTLLATPFLTVTTTSSGERGLLGIAFDPNFTSNQFIYVYYTATTPTTHNRVSRFTANGDVAVTGSETIILELDNLSSATNHNGGAMHFGPDGKLYIAVGENANGANAQSFSNLLGKMLRINSDGTIPTDNPFFATASGKNRAIWALGLRNPYTFAFQPGVGRMFINDVGQNTWEEVNDGIAGSNYGWQICEGNTCSSTPPANYRGPLYIYGHGTGTFLGCAITGGTFYNPSVQQFPTAYNGVYFFADYCGGWINYLTDPANNNSVANFATGISAPVDLQVGPDGALYYLARGGGSSTGSVVKITSTTTGGGTTSALQYYPLAHPIRLLDTRPGQTACSAPGTALSADSTRTQTVTGTCDALTIPTTARAIVGNATVVNDTGTTGGFVTLYPSGATRPTVSNLNFTSGQTVPNSFTSTLGTDGALQIYTSAATHFILDVTGYYAPPAQSGLYFHPLPHPVRLLDTRIGQTACDAPGAPIAGDGTRNEQARTTCEGIIIPADAQAIVGNATVVNTGQNAGGGFVTLYPGGATRPTVSNLNYTPAQVVPNSFTVTLGTDGTFNIYAATQLDFIVDVAGYYSASAAPDANGAAGLLYYPLSAPVRLLDTRASQPACDTPGAPLAADAVRTQAARVTCGGQTIPAAAQAIVGNATVVNSVANAGGGYVTLYPSGAARPGVSNLNYVPGQVVANAFVVGLGMDGAFNIYALTSLHFITDVTGYFAP